MNRKQTLKWLKIRRYKKKVVSINNYLVDFVLRQIWGLK